MRTRISHQSIVPDINFEVCRPLKLQFWDCLYCFWSNQLLSTHLHQW